MTRPHCGIGLIRNPSRYTPDPTPRGTGCGQRRRRADRCRSLVVYQKKFGAKFAHLTTHCEASDTSRPGVVADIPRELIADAASGAARYWPPRDKLRLSLINSSPTYASRVHVARVPR
ncbi:hypothetical protein EVAR_86034_1 [Eumeta japonica]|uniref:Uncharacterized protein n=1 Tax=Eumeta variegata TaxID=151549 RepID=A0A4C1UKN8_EUMVA|nr:hypothetical protein EVAR_86034_1 [Eumeta japonica]